MSAFGSRLSTSAVPDTTPTRLSPPLQPLQHRLLLRLPQHWPVGDFFERALAAEAPAAGRVDLADAVAGAGRVAVHGFFMRVLAEKASSRNFLALLYLTYPTMGVS